MVETLMHPKLIALAMFFIVLCLLCLYLLAYFWEKKCKKELIDASLDLDRVIEEELKKIKMEKIKNV